MQRRPRKRLYALKASALIVLIAVGHYLQTHPMDRQAMVEIAAPQVNLG